MPKGQRTVEIAKGTRTAIDVYLSARYASIDGHVEQSSTSRRLTTIVLQDETAPNSDLRKLARSDGSFTWPALAPGKYRLFAFDDFDRDAWSNPTMATLLTTESREVQVKEGEQEHITLPLISFEEFQEAEKNADF
ncbi:MAG: hypothetical protein WA324_12770 [Bryobacteraceae bacterium]